MILKKSSRGLLAVFTLAALGVAGPGGAQVVISEFMAANDATLADEDGDYSDWIEVYNAGASDVNLANWSLTDDPAHAYRWTFPSVTLGPDRFLVVFASNKNRRVANRQLHTDFVLNMEGGYLALLDPALATATEFDYTPQVEGFSHGFAMNASFASLVGPSAPVKVTIPADGSLGTSWTGVTFSDAGWTAGSAGVGYDTNPEYLSFIGTNVLTAMRNVRGSAYIRFSFNVANPSAFSWLLFRMRYDDGFAAYLNGTRIAVRNAPPTLTWESFASALHDDAAAVLEEDIDIPGAAALLRAGTNVLAIHGLNENLGSSDFLIGPELDGVDSGTLDTGTRLYFDRPSPGFGNLTGYPAITAKPELSLSSRTFTNAFSLQMTPPGGATVRYTLDGSEPTGSSTLYSGPLQVSASTRIRAKAFSAGNAPSPTVTRKYVQLATNVRSFTSNLPLVLLETYGAAVGESNYTDVFAAVIEPGTSGRTAMTALPNFAGNAGIKRRGSSSLGFPKPSLALEIRDDRGNDTSVPLLDMPEESDWVLYAPYTDKTLMRDYLAYLWSNRIGTYAPRARFVEAYLSTGGAFDSSDYVGVYVLIEKIKRDDERVDVKKLGPADSAEPDISGGYILKKDRLDPGDSGFTTGVQNHVLAYVEPKEEEVTPAQAAWIRTYLTSFETALYGASYRDPVNGYAKYIDPPSFVDHHLLVELTKNIDGYRLSTFMHKQRGGKLKMGPIWDYNLCLGNANYLEGWIPQGWYYPQLGAGDYPWWTRLFSDPDFQQKYIDRWGTLRRSQFTNSTLIDDVNETAALLAEAQVRNFQRWPILGQYVWPNQFIGDTYAEEIDFMEGWLVDRLAWMDSNYTPPPVLNQYGGPVTEDFQLTMTAAQGTIRYALDGKDPRLPGGGTSPDAVVYSGPIQISASGNTRIIARANAPGKGWSSPVDVTFYVDTPDLVITEIMYHPPVPPPGPFTQEDFEFIEFMNVGSEPLDLTGVHFISGIEVTMFPSGGFSLPPGERAVAVKNLGAFEALYGLAGIEIAGEYSGNLSNAGEFVGLEGRLNEPIQEFSYSDEWQPMTDGLGHSLVIIDPYAPISSWSQASSWTTSIAEGGSPGEDEGLGGGGRQKPGDANQDSALDISDALAILLRLFGGIDDPLPCEGSGPADGGNLQVHDLNGDSSVDLSDPVFLLGYLFQGGGPPASGTECIRVDGCPPVCR